MPEQKREHFSQSRLTQDPDTFKRWLRGGVEVLGKPSVEELLIDWLAPFLTEAEKDRLIAWNLGLSL